MKFRNFAKKDEKRWRRIYRFYLKRERKIANDQFHDVLKVIKGLMELTKRVIKAWIAKVTLKLSRLYWNNMKNWRIERIVTSIGLTKESILIIAIDSKT